MSHTWWPSREQQKLWRTHTQEPLACLREKPEQVAWCILGSLPPAALGWGVGGYATLCAHRPCIPAVWIVQWAVLLTGASRPSKGLKKEVEGFSNSPPHCVFSPSQPQGHHLKSQAYLMLLPALEPLHMPFPLYRGPSPLSDHHHLHYWPCLLSLFL